MKISVTDKEGRQIAYADGPSWEVRSLVRAAVDQWLRGREQFLTMADRGQPAGAELTIRVLDGRGPT